MDGCVSGGDIHTDKENSKNLPNIRRVSGVVSWVGAGKSNASHSTYTRSNTLACKSHAGTHGSRGKLAQAVGIRSSTSNVCSCLSMRYVLDPVLGALTQGGVIKQLRWRYETSDSSHIEMRPRIRGAEQSR